MSVRKFPTAWVRRIIAGDEDHAAHGSREMPIWGPVFHQIENDQDLDMSGGRM
jgi:hypothetical protein